MAFGAGDSENADSPSDDRSVSASSESGSDPSNSLSLPSEKD